MAAIPADLRRENTSLTVKPRPCFGAGSRVPFASRWLLIALALLQVPLALRTDGAALPFRPPYAMTQWSTRDGLPADRVRALLQDKAGFLWVATFNGVARFDGVHFRQYDVAGAPSLPNNLVNALFEDRAGRIWFGHETGELTIWSDGQFFPVIVPASWRGAPVDEFAEDRSGRVWVRNRRNWLIPVLNKSAGPIVRQLVGQPISEIASDPTCAVWVRLGSRIFEFEPDVGPEPQLGRELPTGELQRPRLCPDRKGGVWIIGDSDMRRWQDGRWTGEAFAAAHSSGRLAMNRWIQTADGGLATGTLNQGIQLVSPSGTETRIGIGEGLPTPFVTALLQDREGNFWAGVADYGLYRIRPGVVAIVRPSGLARPLRLAIEAVVQTRDGSIWAGTEGAGIMRLQDGAWTQFGADAGLSNLVVHALLEDRKGNLWAGLSDGTLSRLAGDRFRRVLASAELAQLSAIFEASNGTLWLGSLHAAGFVDGNAPHFVSSDSEPLTHVRCFAETPDRAVWIATLGDGLGRHAGGRLQVYRRGDGLPSDYLWSLLATADGVLWIGTYDRGLAWRRDGRFHHLGTAEGLPGNTVGQILEADDGALWLGTNGGIARIAREELQAYEEGRRSRVAVVNFSISDGLSTVGIAGGRQASAFRGKDGQLWFASRDGITRIDSRNSGSTTPTPSALIQAVRIDGAETPLASGSAGHILPVPAGSRRLEIDYTAVSLSSPERIRFQHRFEGANTGWTHAETRRTAYFDFLPPGDYAFQVVATSDNDARSSEPAVLRFRVIPKFWETWWFRALVSTVALLAVSGTVALILRARHRRRIEQLERVRAVEHERTRIAHDLHDKIGSGLTELSFLSHSALSATDFAALGSRIGEMQTTTKEMTEAIDEIVWAVNPRHDWLESLVSYLGRSVQDFSYHTGLRCHIDIPITEKNLRMPPEVRHNVFLAVREGLNNVVKHAAATEVRFIVRREGPDLVLHLEDNGRGLVRHGTPVAGGLGLETMHQRLARLGGSVTWSARPGGGTVLTFRLPLPGGPSPELGT